MQKIIILSQGTNGGELANQLWNYVSIYAYALEKSILEKGRIQVINNSFYEYGNFFADLESDRTLFTDTFFFKPFTYDTRRKFSSKKRWYRRFYRLYSNLLLQFHEKDIVSSVPAANAKNKVYLLPPSDEINLCNTANKSTVYFYGWLFRNPTGLTKYRAEIVEHFAPKKDIAVSIHAYIGAIRANYKHVVGVHIRQGDYRIWKNGAYFIDQKKVRQILDEYLAFRKYEKAETCFIIASDEAIDENIFAGLNIRITRKNMVEDLFILSNTDEIIGSDSTFGAFASYYGNIPHIIMKKETVNDSQKGVIDWEYYRDKRNFFENKYSTWVFFR